MDGVAGDSNFGASFGRSLVSVLNQTMEGFRRMKNITVMAASNRPLELANATLSRFELVLPIQNPDQAGRADILQSRFEYRERLSNTKLQGTIDYNVVGARTDGFSGRDLDDLANATCRAVAKRTLFGSGKRHHSKIELISTEDILTTLKSFVKLSEGARPRIGYHPD